MIFKTEGIVLKGLDYGESHRIVHILTPDRGKVSVMAMGAKKTKSKFSANTQPLTLGSFVLYKKGTSLGRINDGQINSSFPNIRNDLMLSTFAMYMTDLTDRVTEELEPCYELYDLLVTVLRMIESKFHDPEILVRIFEIKLFGLRGYRPSLDSCVYCSSVDDMYAYKFSVRQGGFVCKKCSSNDPFSLQMTPSVAKLMRVFQYIELNKIGQISVKKENRQELQGITQRFIEEHFGLQLKWFTIMSNIKTMYDS